MTDIEKTPKISEAEWQVMRVLWAESPMTANDIVRRLGKSTSWKPKTVKTLVSRLVNKKVLDFEKQGREYLYYPQVNEEQCVKSETRSFLDRVKNVGIKPLLAAFMEEQTLSPTEIEELKEILNEKGKK